MGADPQKKSRGDASTSPFPTLLSLPLEVGPLNPARGSGKRCKLRQQGLGGAPAEIEFGAFSLKF